MEISLIRHGRSLHSNNSRITCAEFQNWIEKYDDSGVYEEIHYPIETIKKIAAAKIVITSDLRRSIESANLFIHENIMVSDKIYRETELPALPKRIGLKLRPNSWAILLRCLWLCGYSKQCESLVNAQQRAKQAAKRLVKYTEEHQSVVIVGHGFFNQFIAKELKRIGWNGKRKSNSKHWNCTTYSL